MAARQRASKMLSRKKTIGLGGKERVEGKTERQKERGRKEQGTRGPARSTDRRSVARGGKEARRQKERRAENVGIRREQGKKKE